MQRSRLSFEPQRTNPEMDADSESMATANQLPGGLRFKERTDSWKQLGRVTRRREADKGEGSEIHILGSPTQFIGEDTMLQSWFQYDPRKDCRF